MTDSCNKFIPRTRIPQRPFSRWFNSDIRHQLNKVHSLRKHSKKNPTSYILHKLTHMEATLQTLMDKSKDEFLHSISSSFHFKPKQLYSYLSSLNKSKSKPDFLTLSWSTFFANISELWQVATTLLVAGPTLTFWIPWHAFTYSYSNVVQSARLLVPINAHVMWWPRCSID